MTGNEFSVKKWPKKAASAFFGSPGSLRDSLVQLTWDFGDQFEWSKYTKRSQNGQVEWQRGLGRHGEEPGQKYGHPLPFTGLVNMVLLYGTWGN